MSDKSDKYHIKLSPWMVQMILPAIALFIAGWVVMYGKTEFFSAEDGEKVEQKQVDLEKVVIRLDVGQQYTNEQLSDIKVILMKFADSKGDK